MFRERKHIRLRNYDYSSDGLYFITLNCKDREKLFGAIESKQMVLNDVGRIAQQYWAEIPQHFKHVILSEFIVMPDHMHGILQLDKDNHGIHFVGSMPWHEPTKTIFNQFGKQIPGSISMIINQ